MRWNNYHCFCPKHHTRVNLLGISLEHWSFFLGTRIFSMEKTVRQKLRVVAGTWWQAFTSAKSSSSSSAGNFHSRSVAGSGGFLGSSRTWLLHIFRLKRWFQHVSTCFNMFQHVSTCFNMFQLASGNFTIRHMVLWIVLWIICLSFSIN